MDIPSTRIDTAGAYICINGLYLFAIGIRPYHGHIPVVRLGGHREGNETSWQCAAREVREEASLKIQHLPAPTTYVYNWGSPEVELQEIHWQHKIEQHPAPFLVVTYCHDNDSHLSVMYLAQAEGSPAPSSEVKGLVLLREDEVHALCCRSITLEQYLCNGGKAILNAEFDRTLVLEPLAQLRLLSQILRKSKSAIF